MNKTISPGIRSGRVKIPASKSQAHRLLIVAALGRGERLLHCDGLSADIKATIRCLNALGADITETSPGTLRVRPIDKVPEGLCHLYCGESGSTLRFLLPLCPALGAQGVFHMEGRLPQRPLAPLDSQLEKHGAVLKKDGGLLYVSGRLSPGDYSLPGDVSSQYISALLMALPLLQGDSRLEIWGDIESAGYIDMTLSALELGGMAPETSPDGRIYHISGGRRSQLPQELQVEGDWSNAAFFLSMGALSPEGVRVEGLDLSSRQGDRAAEQILRSFGADIQPLDGGLLVRRGELKGIEIDARAIPDLIPVLSVVAALSQGETVIKGAGRLRLKESDRLKSTAALIQALGGRVQELEEGLRIEGLPRLAGGRAEAWGDHRIAMAAAVAACGCTGKVELEGAQAVEKSYPRFWQDFEALEGGAL